MSKTATKTLHKLFSKVSKELTVRNSHPLSRLKSGKRKRRMGEVFISSENGMDLRVQETEMQMETARLAAEDGGGATPAAVAAAGSFEAVRWERFLPNMVVRVLLVEADDSTRQIISALLMKCSYKVAAVADGLKAWEVLKARPHNIDLILTEVDLPSISGYALLTLIMEHDVCKNIPVIMMSSQDSVSTVYKCMLRGATDFLVKPVRKNELRNLWQHVWRKQASSTSAGLGPPDERVAREKDEATAENNATSNNHSSGYMSCIQQNKEGIEKGSDAHSSCTRPESGTEDEDMEHVHGPSKSERAKCVSDGISTPGQEECHQQSSRNQKHESETEGLQVVAKSKADYALTREREDKNSDYMQEDSTTSDTVPEYILREAIDLIGTFDTHLKGTFRTSAAISSASKSDILPMLDLSLKRSQPSGFMSQVNDERTGLNHSGASAFSRYINKPLQLNNQQKDHEMNSENQPLNPILSSPPMPSSKIQQPEFTFPHSQNRDISHPIPVRGGVGFGNVISPYGSFMPSIYGEKPSSPPLPNHGTAHHSESFLFPLDHQTSSSQQLQSPADQRNSNSIDEAEHRQQGNKFEECDDHGLISHGATANQSGNSIFSNGTTNAAPVMNVPSECGSGHEESFHLHEGASHRAMQREVALTKFRQKRKDRCFEKKVRYESRKKLAEQRPRVKGQFVRQMPNEQAVNSSAG